MQEVVGLDSEESFLSLDVFFLSLSSFSSFLVRRLNEENFREYLA